MTEQGHMLRSLSRSKIEMTLAGMNLDQSKLIRMDGGQTARREGRSVFECSWEVANKVWNSSTNPHKSAYTYRIKIKTFRY
ncbi:unnamed protein product [Onchocerca flexuosa]|uniref:Glycogen [starch] synthase n=1 Tax=Onchocerca flexuosa TaxID=387005 RepID=A0A183HBC6_9BILA|nr:unnamed protein product [Onchocerca flexuosa]